MEQVQLRLKESGKTVVYTANDLTLTSVKSFLDTCLKDYGVMSHKVDETQTEIET